MLDFEHAGTDNAVMMQPRAVPWPEFRAELLALYAPPLRALATQREMRHALDLVAAAGVSDTSGLTVQAIATLVKSRPASESANTTIKTLRHIRAAANVAVRQGSLRISPFAIRPVKAWLRPAPPQGRRHCSREEIRRLLDVLKADVERRAAAGEMWATWRARRLLALVATACYTGMRRDEMLYLHAADVDLAARSITIRSRPGERRVKTTASEAVIPIPAALATILGDWASHRLDPPPFPPPAEVPWYFPGSRGRGPWRDGARGAKPIDALQTAARRAGIGHVTFQSLRRSWAVHAESAWGFSGPLIQRVLRHTTERTAETWYRAADLPNLRQATDGIDF